jgi:hypothetical protein
VVVSKFAILLCHYECSGGEGEGMAKQEAAFTMSCNVRSLLPVSPADYGNARRRSIWRCSFTFPWSFKSVKGINLCVVLPAKGADCRCPVPEVHRYVVPLGSDAV